MKTLCLLSMLVDCLRIKEAYFSALFIWYQTVLLFNNHHRRDKDVPWIFTKHHALQTKIILIEKASKHGKKKKKNQQTKQNKTNKQTNKQNKKANRIREREI